MIYIPQALTDAWLMEDIQGGDLTTRALGTGNQAGIIEFRHRQGGCVSGIAPAEQMLRSLGLTVTARLEDGAQARPGEVLLRAYGRPVRASVRVCVEREQCDYKSADKTECGQHHERPCPE